MYIKTRSSQRRCSIKKLFSCEYCEIFNNTYLEEQLRTTTSRKLLFVMVMVHGKLTLENCPQKISPYPNLKPNPDPKPRGNLLWRQCSGGNITGAKFPVTMIIFLFMYSVSVSAFNSNL